jgi:hypothetical protein
MASPSEARPSAARPSEALPGWAPPAWQSWRSGPGGTSIGTLYPYPTLAEAGKHACGEWKRAHAPHKLLRWVVCFHAGKRA